MTNTIKKELKALIVAVAIGICTLGMVGCQRNDSETIVTEKSLSLPETRSYRNPETQDIHRMLTSIYEVGNNLYAHWSKREEYKLNHKDFENDYIYQYMTFYLYEAVRFLSPSEDEYITNSPYIESITIDEEHISHIDGLLLVPVIVNGRDYVPREIDPQEWDDKDNIYEQFFVLKKVDNRFVIVNFISGYISSIKDEVYPKVRPFEKNDWEKSIYSKEGRERHKQQERNDWIIDEYIQFIQGDETKENYVFRVKKQLTLLKNNIAQNQTYNRSAAVNYALAYTSTTSGTSSYNPTYRHFSVDCANYVSQCLKAGGFVNRGNSYTSCNSWYYNSQGTDDVNDDTHSITWSTANGLKRYLYDCGALSTVLTQSDLWYGTNISLGDPFFSDWTYPSQGEAPYYNHSMIITQIVGSDIRYSAHTSNRKNRTLHHTSTNYDFWFTDAWTRGFHIENLN